MKPSVESSRTQEKKYIFVVETDEVVRSALQFMLRSENETCGLASLEQAYAKGREWTPDLVLLGAAIVQAHGLHVLGDIAAHLPGAKILLVADSPDDPLAQACLACGAHDVLGKPIAVKSVRSKVDVLLVRRKLPVATSDVLATALR